MRNNSWLDFLKTHKGQGFSRETLSSMYRNLQFGGNGETDDLEGSRADNEDYSPRYLIGRDCPALLQTGLQITKQLGCGFSACTYLACRIDKCDLVIKIGDISDKEIMMSKKMAELGIGPRVFSDFICPIIGEGPPQEGYHDWFRYQQTPKTSSRVLLLEKLHNTLESYKNLTMKDLESIASLAKKAAKLGLYHSDLHEGNIMSVDNGEWKLIDFGAKFTGLLHDNFQFIVEEWMQLISSLKSKLSPDIDSNQFQLFKDKLEADLLDITKITSYSKRPVLYYPPLSSYSYI